MVKDMAYLIGIRQAIDKRILVISVASRVRKFSSMFTILMVT
tara:strand:- start:487 stop:612 length:126 start_codon:yes stop_codon:yes gene_type:complete